MGESPAFMLSAPATALRHLAQLWSTSTATSRAISLRLAGRGDIMCMAKEESWDAKRLVGRIFGPLPPHLVTTTRR